MQASDLGSASFDCRSDSLQFRTGYGNRHTASTRGNRRSHNCPLDTGTTGTFPSSGDTGHSAHIHRGKRNSG